MKPHASSNHSNEFMKPYLFFVWVGLISLIAIFVGCTKPNNQEVKLGALLAQSGQNSQWGANARQGILLTLDKINADGGVNGIPLSVVFEDSKGEPRQALSGFNKLRDLNGVSAVIGDIMSATTLACAPSANSSKTPMIAVASAPAVTEAGPYVYRVWPSDVYEGQIAADWASEVGNKRAALVFVNNDYGSGIKNAFKHEFLSRGGEIVAEEAFESDPQSIRNVAAKLKGGAADIVYIVGYYENTALMVKNLREVGITAPLLGTSSAMHSKIVEVAGSAAEGFSVAVVNDIDEDNLTPEQKTFFEDYKKRFGQKPDWAAVKASDALLILTECLKGGAKTGEEIKNTLDSIQKFKGISNEITFDENGDVKNKPIVIKQIRDGKFVLEAVPKLAP